MKTKEQCLWLEYAVFDENGEIIELKDNTPDDVKQAYQEHIDYIDNCNKNNIFMEK